MWTSSKWGKVGLFKLNLILKVNANQPQSNIVYATLHNISNGNWAHQGMIPCVSLREAGETCSEMASLNHS